METQEIRSAVRSAIAMKMADASFDHEAWLDKNYSINDLKSNWINEADSKPKRKTDPDKFDLMSGASDFVLVDMNGYYTSGTYHHESQSWSVSGWSGSDVKPKRWMYIPK